MDLVTGFVVGAAVGWLVGHRGGRAHQRASAAWVHAQNTRKAVRPAYARWRSLVGDAVKAAALGGVLVVLAGIVLKVYPS